MNISAALGVAVREFPMLTGEADYLLYVDGKAIGVVEAKPKGHPLIGVETQSAKYVGGSPARRSRLHESPAVRLRDHRRRHAVHEPAGTRRPQPGGLHLPSARGTAPAGRARRPGARQAASAAGARRLEALVGAEASDREPGAVAGQEQPPLADPDGDRQRARPSPPSMPATGSSSSAGRSGSCSSWTATTSGGRPTGSSSSSSAP